MKSKNDEKKKMVKNNYIYILLFLFFFSAASFAAQEKKNAEQQVFSCVFQDATIQEVMSYIEKNSGYVFLYADNRIAQNKISLNIKKQTITQILDRLLENTGFGYEIDGKQIVVKEKTSTCVQR